MVYPTYSHFRFNHLCKPSQEKNFYVASFGSLSLLETGSCGFIRINREDRASVYVLTFAMRSELILNNTWETLIQLEEVFQDGSALNNANHCYDASFLLRVHTINPQRQPTVKASTWSPCAHQSSMIFVKSMKSEVLEKHYVMPLHWGDIIRFTRRVCIVRVWVPIVVCDVVFFSLICHSVLPLCLIYMYMAQWIN